MLIARAGGTPAYTSHERPRPMRQCSKLPSDRNSSAGATPQVSQQKQLAEPYIRMASSCCTTACTYSRDSHVTNFKATSYCESPSVKLQDHIQVYLLHNLLRSPRLLVPDVLAASQLVVAPSTIFTDPRQAVT